MGSTLSLDSGIQQYEVYLLLGDLSSIFDEVIGGKISIENGKQLVLNRLFRLNRVSLNEKPKNFISTPHYKIFPEDKPLLEITEKYRDADGQHAWSIALQYRPGAKIVKILHGLPGNEKKTTEKKPSREKILPGRMSRSVSLDDLTDYSKKYYQPPQQKSQKMQPIQRQYPGMNFQKYSSEPNPRNLPIFNDGSNFNPGENQDVLEFNLNGYT